MLNRIEQQAEVSVGRACGFAAVAVVTFMVGLSGDVLLSMKAGGFLVLITALVLVLKAWHSPHQYYKHTELWLLLNENERPQAAIAQQVIGGVLRQVYFRFALHAASISALLLLAAMIYGLFFPRLV